MDSFYTPCIALLYHRINDLPVDHQLLCVTPENFHDHVRYLKNNFALLDIDEFIEIKKNKRKKFNRKSVVLTFDDGYADNFYGAVPVLETLNAQALFYIATEHLDTQNEFWWDEFEKIMTHSALPDSLELETSNQKYFFSTKTSEEKLIAYHALHPVFKYKKKAEQKVLLDQLRSWSGLHTGGQDSHRILTGAEIKKMSLSKSVVLGAHTHTHTPLSLLNYREQMEEIKTSKEIIERIIEKPVRHFSYPYGEKRDYNSDSLKSCKELGFQIVFSNFPSIIYQPVNNYELPRFLVRNWSLEDFKMKLNSFFQPA